MKLSKWAKSQGINYSTAYSWFKKGCLPVAAYQIKETGTIIIGNPAAGVNSVEGEKMEKMEGGK